MTAALRLILPDPPAAAHGALSELEAQLQGPGAAQARQAALSRIDALEARLRAAMLAGAAPAAFTELSLLLVACQAAREVLTIPPQP